MLISTVGIGDTVVSETLGISDPGGLCSRQMLIIEPHNYVTVIRELWDKEAVRDLMRAANMGLA